MYHNGFSEVGKEMKKYVLIFCIALVLPVAFFCGCTEESSSDTVSSNTISSEEHKAPEQVQEPESIESILTKPDTMDSIYYEISMDMDISEIGQQSALIKVWQKEPYIKEDITSAMGGYSTSILVIQGPDGTYVYDAEQDRYIISTDDMPSISTSLQYFDSDMILSSIANQTLSNFEKEIIDGKETTVIEYSPVLDDDFIHVKMWIWNEKGVPLKGIITMSMDEMTMSMEFIYSNYSFEEIPDSVFSIS